MRSIPAASTCCRKSGVVSITIEARPGTSTWMDGRSRLSRGSVDRHTSQAQPIIGTPEDVPVPRKVTRPGTDVNPSTPLAPGRRSPLDSARGDPEPVEGSGFRAGSRRSRNDDARGLRGRPLLAGLDVAKPQLVEDLIEELALLGGQIAARLLLEQREDVDHLLRGRQIRRDRLSRDRVRHVTEVNRSCVGERQNEAKERNG